jgi:hypothetical protein
MHVAATKTDQCMVNKEFHKQVADSTGACDDLQESRLNPVQAELKAQVSRPSIQIVTAPESMTGLT